MASALSIINCLIFLPSSMGVRVSRDTRNWQTGIISSVVLKLSGLARPRRTVRTVTSLSSMLIASYLVPPVPIFGGGDCYSSQDYWSCIENSSVDGVMIGRGALIKPWIFTEIKEHREWDIRSVNHFQNPPKLQLNCHSSRERLEGIRQVSCPVFPFNRR